MSALTAIWSASLLLCAVGIIALFLLILARLLSKRTSRSRAKIRRRLMPLLLGRNTSVERLFGKELRLAASLTHELAEFVRGTDRKELLAVAEALGVPDLLNRRARSPAAQDRLTAIEALALFESHTKVIEDAIKDKNSHVRLGAALALSARGDVTDILEIVLKLRIGEVENSLFLIPLMSDIAKQDPLLVRHLLIDPSFPDSGKVAAIDALADSGYIHASLLVDISKSIYFKPELQPKVFQALGRTGHPASALAIEAGLASNDWRVRAASAEATGQIALTGLAEDLGGLLSDDQWWVRLKAGEALLKLGETGVAIMHRAAVGSEAVACRAATTLLAERAAT